MTAPVVHHGDCIEVMRGMADNSIDAIVTDPPYGLGFMGKAWDDLPPGIDWAAECLRILNPGGHLLAFGGTRTWHRLACAIEDAGFEIRDSIAWLYGSGFPKSLDVSKAIDKAARGVPQGGTDPTSPNHGRYRTTTTEGKRWDGDSGQGYGAGGSRFLVDGTAGGSATGPAAYGVAATAPDDVARQWEGWGTALKPAFEPVVMARKPLVGTVAANVIAHGAGALNIDGCRIETDDALTGSGKPPLVHGGMNSRPFHAEHVATPTQRHAAGRWPANVALDEDQAAALDQMSGNRPSNGGAVFGAGGYGGTAGANRDDRREIGYGDTGGASRFFYVAKAPAKERPSYINVDGQKIAHATVKPVTLMRHLVRLVTPPGGTLLDPFAGSGTTIEAAMLEGFDVIGIEREADYLPLIQSRIDRNTYEQPDERYGIDSFTLFDTEGETA